MEWIGFRRGKCFRSTQYKTAIVLVRSFSLRSKCSMFASSTSVLFQWRQSIEAPFPFYYADTDFPFLERLIICWGVLCHLTSWKLAAEFDNLFERSTVELHAFNFKGVSLCHVTVRKARLSNSPTPFRRASANNFQARDGGYSMASACTALIST